MAEVLLRNGTLAARDDCHRWSVVALHLAIVYEARRCGLLIGYSLVQWLGRHAKLREICCPSSEGAGRWNHVVGVRVGTKVESDQISWKTSDARPQMPSSRACAQSRV